MDWLPKTEPKTLVFSKKSLTPTGFINTQSIKLIKKPLYNKEKEQEDGEELAHPEYSSKNIKEIFDYFSFISETRDYCEEVIQKSKIRYEVFCSHPLFSKFWSRIHQEYNPNWKYCLILLRKDRKIVEEMRRLLRDVVENPSQVFEFADCDAGVEADWGKALKNLQYTVKSAPKKHKKELKKTFFKLKSRT